MGQTITVSARPGARPEVRIFELNRSLTGMGIERYASPADARGGRPADVLAQRLLGLGARAVTVYSNLVTVEAPEWRTLEARVVTAVEHLFEYYGDDAGWSPEVRGVPAVAPAATEA